MEEEVYKIIPEKELHAHGIHTAMESMACADFSTIKRFLENLDLYLMDIKHMEPEKHKAFTGRSNGRCRNAVSAIDAGTFRGGVQSRTEGSDWWMKNQKTTKTDKNQQKTTKNNDFLLTSRRVCTII